MSQETMLIRQHRGGLGEAVATMQRIPATIEAVRDYLRKTNTAMPFSEAELATVEVKLYSNMPENRIQGWDGETYSITYIAMPEQFQGKEGCGRGVVGFCNRPVESGKKETPPEPEIRRLPVDARFENGKRVILESGRAQAYLHAMIVKNIHTGDAFEMLEFAGKALTGHFMFKDWCTGWNRDTSDKVLNFYEELEYRLGVLTFMFDHMIAAGLINDLDLMLESLRLRGVPIVNEPNQEYPYNLALKGDWGFLLVYQGK
jgi:hypothetical protein